MDKKEFDQTNLPDFALLCQDEDWLSAFIQDTEEHHMMTAPSRLKADTLVKTEKLPLSKGIQFITYSLRVSLAAAGAILILFTTPVILEHSAAGVYSSAVTAEAAYQLNSRLYRLSNSIYHLSNELFTGR